jgi:lactoylglutathione lyase
VTLSPQGIFEVHLAVADRCRSVEFYRLVVGGALAAEFPERDVTFLWLGQRGAGLLGLWGPACPDPPIARARTHFAMQMGPDDVERAPERLRALGVTPRDFHGRPTEEAIVIAWMPAVAVYFEDPDGHSLEFISMLAAAPAPELGVVPLGAWKTWKGKA